MKTRTFVSRFLSIFLLGTILISVDGYADNFGIFHTGFISEVPENTINFRLPEDILSVERKLRSGDISLCKASVLLDEMLTNNFALKNVESGDGKRQYGDRVVRGFAIHRVIDGTKALDVCVVGDGGRGISGDPCSKHCPKEFSAPREEFLETSENSSRAT